MEFVLGQRWVSQTESELGLGIVVEIEGRHITVRFPAADEDRVYAQNNSPLARVKYQVGDTIQDLQGDSLQVVGVEDLEGLACYLVTGESSEERILPETQISGQIQLSSPSQRLFSGQFDKSREYELRVAALQHRADLQQSPARGLLGVRTSLLPHQVYIAHEVASRYAPRVLLADEVGLGKTIEAGMILHHQLQTGLASRALIVVPNALLHQWLVEMLRKFNLHFSLFDYERYHALLESDGANPFESEQLVLCGMDVFVEHEQMAAHAKNAGWDLLIVDEAHHLQWSPDSVSEEYLAIERLSQACAGLLLLTATPEQLGLESHFARLRLLDPTRFSDIEKFREESQNYAKLNELVQQLLSTDSLSIEQQQQLSSFKGIDVDGSNDKIIEQLLDQHGTGRVLFRNTRSAIKGFPQRIVHGVALDATSNTSKDSTTQEFDDLDIDSPVSDLLYPEQPKQRLGEEWLKDDPRVSWLESFFKSMRHEKVLLICSSAQTALDLEHYLHLNVGIRSAAFYEGLSIIERDRAAAYFADLESGAQTLICSEIGSEGRNFQFAQHLVLFDLPLNPDLLEQRIGRLDRIGQMHDVQIHVPYVAGSAQEVLFRWYHEGLDAFCQSFSAGSVLFEKFSAELENVMVLLSLGLSEDNVVNDDVASRNDQALQQLITTTRDETIRVRAELQAGRDQLLELNSCRTEIAQQVIDKINLAEAIEEDPDPDVIDLDASTKLQSFMIDTFDVFGIEYEHHSEHSLVLRPSEHMLVDSIPHLSEEGLTITFDRTKALAREDMEFVTWEAPLVGGLMETLLGSELGNTAISTLELKAIPAGTLLVECYFNVQVSAPKKLQLGRFLPATPIRILLDSKGRDLSAAINHQQLSQLCQKIRKSARPAIIKEIRPQLEDILKKAEELAGNQVSSLKRQATKRVEEVVGSEVVRLQQLSQVNPSIRQDEIDFFSNQAAAVEAQIQSALLESQAVRVIITM